MCRLKHKKGERVTIPYNYYTVSLFVLVSRCCFGVFYVSVLAVIVKRSYAHRRWAKIWRAVLCVAFLSVDYVYCGVLKTKIRDSRSSPRARRVYR
jgi:hypothetical protein